LGTIALRAGQTAAQFACAKSVKGHMKSRIAITILITLCFVAMYFTHNISTYLLIGNWIGGFTGKYWWTYIFISLFLCFVSCFYPKARNLLLVIIAPLLVTLICKSLSIMLILVFQKLSILSLAMGLSGLLLAYLFLVLYWQLGADLNQTILVATIITIGLSPVAYEFTQQMLEQPLTSQGSNATSWLDALTRAAA
jgi:hypothetical protein